MGSRDHRIDFEALRRAAQGHVPSGWRLVALELTGRVDDGTGNERWRVVCRFVSPGGATRYIHCHEAASPPLAKRWALDWFATPFTGWR